MPATTVRSRLVPARLFREGARDMLPLATGFMPFAFVIGTAVTESAIDDLAGWAGSFLIAAGSAHLAVVQMVDDGAAPLAIIATAIIINARLAVYGAGLAPWFAHEPAGRRRVIAYFVVDPTYLIAVSRFERDDPGPAGRRSYYLGAAAVLFAGWTVAQTVAVLIGNRVPTGVGLDLAAPLIMAGWLAESVRDDEDRVALVAIVVAGTVAITGAGLPWSSATLLAIVAGCVAGAHRTRG